LYGCQAVKKQTGLDNVVVTHSSIYLGGARAIIPVRVKQKIRHFDKFGFVLPFSFDLMLTETAAKSAHAFLVAR